MTNTSCMRLALLFLACISCASCRKATVPEVSAAPRPTSPSIASSAPANSTAAPGQPIATTSDAQPTVKHVKTIHDVDVEAFLNTHYGELDSTFEDLKDQCPEGDDPIRNVEIQYGDLDSDGQDEALFQGYTCMAGTSGVDYSGIVKLQPDGKLVGLPIAHIPDTFKGRDPFEGLRGHTRWDIQNGRFVEIYPVYKEGECEACSSGGERKFVFRWDGHQFVLNDIIDIPPDKAGN
jgi:hypothetical protein